MDKHSFRQTFDLANNAGIGTCFNWSRFMNDTAIVLQSVELDPADFNKLYAPWYLDETDNPTSFCSPQARPITIAEAAIRGGAFGKSELGPNLARINSLVKEFKQTEQRIITEIPAVALPDNCYLILDRNHRLTALAIHALAKPVRIELFAIGGIVGPYLVPDLSHWLKL